MEPVLLRILAQIKFVEPLNQEQLNSMDKLTTKDKQHALHLVMDKLCQLKHQEVPMFHSKMMDLQI